MKIGTCKLCLQERELLTKSHIIPEFMYQGLFDEHHKIHVFKPEEMAKGEGYIRRPSSGEYESDILCKHCDNVVIGNYETYASKALYGGVLPSYECPIFTNGINQAGLKLSQGRNISYIKMKLFYLSILWRASISTRPLFSEVALGEHEGVLRKMILDGDAARVEDYPIFFLTYINDKDAPKDLIAQPQKRIASSGHETFIFIIGGIVCFYYMNSYDHKIPNMILSETIRPSNEVNIYHANSGWDILSRFYGL